MFTSNSMFRVHGKSELTLHDVFDPNLMTAHVTEDMQRQFVEFQKDGITLSQHVLGPAGAGYVEEQLLSNKGMQVSADAILASIVSESWTAFECLVSDVWVEALNNGPRDIANRVVIHKDLKRRDDPITVRMLVDLEYDVRKELGAFLRETRRVSFQTLDGIVAAYSMAFGPDSVELFKTIDGGFIEALSACRNILAHKAGVADKDFMKQIEKIPEFNNCSLKTPVFLDGRLVSKMRNGAVNLGLALIGYVDNVLTPL